MSIYATMECLKFPINGEFAWGEAEGEWIEVLFQGVPGHITYEGPEWEWLPPPSADENTPRAVVVIDARTKKGTERCGQEYVEPLLVLSWTDYQAARWEHLHQRIAEELAKRWHSGFDRSLGSDKLDAVKDMP